MGFKNEPYALNSLSNIWVSHNEINFDDADETKTLRV